MMSALVFSAAAATSAGIASLYGASLTMPCLKPHQTLAVFQLPSITACTRSM